MGLHFGLIFQHGGLQFQQDAFVPFRQLQGAILLFPKFHTVLFERGGSGVKSQILIHGAHLFKYVPVAVLDHQNTFYDQPP